MLNYGIDASQVSMHLFKSKFSAPFGEHHSIQDIKAAVSDHSTQLIDAVQWLLVLPEQRRDAFTQLNKLMRMFLLHG